MRTLLNGVLVWFCLVSIAALAVAEVRFGAARHFKLGMPLPEELVAVDLNEDGHLDLAIVERFEGELVIMFGDGAGGFAPSQTLFRNTSPTEILSGDLNEDLHADLVVANSGPQDGVTVLLGDGAGGLPVVVDYPLAGSVSDLVLDDFNEDGHLDVAATQADFGSTEVAILLGDGAGAFGAPIYLDTGWDFLRHSSAADLNEDGHVDLIVTHGDENRMTVLFGNGDASFAPMPVGLPSRASEVVAVDLNEDGHLDLVVSGIGLLLLLGDGSGGFGAPVTIGLASQSSGSLVADDFNEDGHADIVVNHVTVLLGDGTGGLAPPRSFIAGRNISDVAAADFDGDGHLDLVTLASLFQGEIEFMRGVGNGDFEGIRLWVAAPNASAILARDFDADGDLDLVVADQDQGIVRLFTGLGNGVFGPFNYERYVGESPSFLRAGDWNGDGLLDVAVQKRQGFSISMLLNNGAGHFHPPYTIPLGGGLRPFDAVDFNDDGRLDLVVPIISTETIGVLEGNGSGGFFLRGFFATTSSPEFLLCADFDEDGELDAAVAGSSLAIHLGDGDGNPGPPITIGAGIHPASLASGDFDEDGHVDLVVGNREGSVRVLLGDGAAGFTEVQALESTYSQFPPVITTGDLDGDGHEDLAIAVDSPGGVLIFQGNGTGQFVLSQYAAGDLRRGEQGLALALGDLHEDGQLDIAVGSWLSDRVLIILNHSLGVPIVRRCLRGAVNSGVEPVADVLFVNGSAGDDERIVEIGGGQRIECSLIAAPGGGNGQFVMHANFGAPGAKTATELPIGIGASCNAFLLTRGAEPAAVWNCVGKERQVGASIDFDGSPLPEPSPAPTTFLDLPTGDPVYLPVGTVVTFQGAMIESGSASPRGASMTNTVIIKIL